MAKPDVDKELIRELATLLDETGLTEIEVEEGDRRIRIARHAATAVAAAPAVAAAAPPPAPSAPAAEAATTGDPASHPGAVASPMVGTAYRAPDPEAPPFVNVGEAVRAGQTVLIIEAMKTFNEIPAPRDGTVREVFFDNGTPVEFGDVLMIID